MLLLNVAEVVELKQMLLVNAAGVLEISLQMLLKLFCS